MALLLDVNVWLDFHFPFRSGHDTAVTLVHAAAEKDIDLFVSASSLSDFFYLAQALVKRQLGPDAPNAAAFARQYAWQMVDCLLDWAFVSAIDQGDAWVARHYRRIHDDFEDDLVIAAALRCKAAYLITNDEALLHHSPVPALSAAEWVAQYAR